MLRAVLVHTSRKEPRLDVSGRLLVSLVRTVRSTCLAPCLWRHWLWAAGVLLQAGWLAAGWTCPSGSVLGSPCGEQPSLGDFSAHMAVPSLHTQHQNLSRDPAVAGSPALGWQVSWLGRERPCRGRHLGLSAAAEVNRLKSGQKPEALAGREVGRDQGPGLQTKLTSAERESQAEEQLSLTRPPGVRPCPHCPDSLPASGSALLSTASA